MDKTSVCWMRGYYYWCTTRLDGATVQISTNMSWKAYEKFWFLMFRNIALGGLQVAFTLTKTFIFGGNIQNIFILRDWSVNAACSMVIIMC